MEIIISGPPCSLIWVGCLLGAPGTASSGFPLVLFTQEDSSILLAECGPLDNVLAVKRRGHMKTCYISPSVDTAPCLFLFTFNCAGHSWARDTLTFYYGKFERFTKSWEDSAIIPYVPITQVHKWSLHEHFPFICIPHPLPQIILKHILDISVLCFLETEPPEFRQSAGVGGGGGVWDSNFFSGSFHCGLYISILYACSRDTWYRQSWAW